MYSLWGRRKFSLFVDVLSVVVVVPSPRPLSRSRIGPPGPRRLRHQWRLLYLPPCSLMMPLDFVQLW